MYHVIINPASQSGQGKTLWTEQVEPAMKAAGVSYEAHYSAKAGDISRLVAEVAANSTEHPVRIIILGGDGTFNEALQKVSNTKDVIFGYIPTGSSNDFARDVQIPSDPRKAIEIILKDNPVPMDIGQITYDDGVTHRFAVSAGMGFDAAVCAEVQQSSLKEKLNRLGLGKLVYLTIALKQIMGAKYGPCRIILDNKVELKSKSLIFVACMVHRYEGGGFMFCPDATAQDGLLHLCVAGDIMRLRLPLLLPKALKGRHFEDRKLTAYSARKVRIESKDPLWVHTDGETERKVSDLTVEVLPGAMNILL